MLLTVQEPQVPKTQEHIMFIMSWQTQQTMSGKVEEMEDLPEHGI